MTDTDIINWSITHMTAPEPADEFPPFGNRYRRRDWAVINFDDGTQVRIQAFPSPAGTFDFNDAFIVSYRNQQSNAADQKTLGWWDIAFGTFTLDDTSISWRGFVKNSHFGIYLIRDLSRSPLN